MKKNDFQLTSFEFPKVIKSFSEIGQQFMIAYPKKQLPLTHPLFFIH